MSYRAQGAYSAGSMIAAALSPPVALSALAVLALIGLSACSNRGSRVDNASLGSSHVDRPVAAIASERRASEAQPIPKGGGAYKLGPPYRMGSRWYVPREDPTYDHIGMGSWYGSEFHGRKTANGEVYDMNALTAAHPTLPLPSYAYVTNQANGRTILVRINDRGPYAHDRLIDVSRAAARALDFEVRGRANLRVRYAGRAPLNGTDHHERRFLASQPWWGGGRTDPGAEVSAAIPRRPPSEPRYGEPLPSPAAPQAWSPESYRRGLAAQGRTPAWRPPSGLLNASP